MTDYALWSAIIKLMVRRLVPGGDAIASNSAFISVAIDVLCVSCPTIRHGMPAVWAYGWHVTCRALLNPCWRDRRGRDARC